ncbi:MAG: hypothetical protein JRI34_13145 [Deltaproteobacteria bacterium]|nr:hypothetical protein [Deltaproteobacteria bacterium]
MSTDRELRFILKVKDDGSAVLQKASLEFDALAQTERQAQTASEGLNQSFDYLDRQVGLLTDSLKMFDLSASGTKEVFGAFIKGIQTGLRETVEDMYDWAEAGGELAENAAYKMTSTLDEILFATLKGEFDEVGKIWEGTLDNMLRAFTGFVSQVAAMWTFNQLADILGLNFFYSMVPDQSVISGGSGMSLLGAVAGGYGLHNLLAGGGGAGTPLVPGMMPVLTEGGGMAAANITASGGAGAGSGLWASISSYFPYAAGALAGWYLLKKTGIGTTLKEGAQDILEEIPVVGGVASDIVGGIGKIFGFQHGTPFVPETAPAIVHRGERILSADDNKRLVQAIESGAGGVTIHGPLINVEGSLAADEVTLERFVEEIEERLKRLAERRF